MHYGQKLKKYQWWHRGDEHGSEEGQHSDQVLLDDEHIPKVEMAACIAMQCVKCDVMQVWILKSIIWLLAAATKFLSIFWVPAICNASEMKRGESFLCTWLWPVVN